MTHRTLTLTCDHCGAIARRHMTEYEHESIVLPAWRIELFAEGWVFNTDGDICPGCTGFGTKPINFLPAQEIRA